MVLVVLMRVATLRVAILGAMALFLLTAGASTLKAQGAALPEEGIQLFLPLINRAVTIPPNYAPLVVVVAVLIVLVYYVPVGLTAIRESLSGLSSRKAALEAEKLSIEIRKLRYEIEILRQTHSLPDLEPPLPDVTIVLPPPGPSIMPGPALATPAPVAASGGSHFLGRRFLAFLIDYFVVSLVLGILLAVFPPFQNDMVLVPAVYALPTGYFVVAWAVWGATAGQGLLGLRVVRRDGSQLSLGKAAARFVLAAITSLPFLLGFLWALRRQSGGTLYDRLAGTTVIRSGSGTPAAVDGPASV